MTITQSIRPPFFDDTNGRNRAQLFWGDCLDILRQFKAQSFDMVFADPPYGLSNGGMSCHAGKRVSVNKGDWDKSRGVKDDFHFHRRWLRACQRVLKPEGTLWVSGTYHSIYACGFAMQLDGWHVLNEISWYKPNAAPHLACRMYAASHETLIWARKSKTAKHFFDYDFARNHDWGKDFLKKPQKQMRSVWAINTPPASEKSYGKHPTQKPLALLERITRTCTRPQAHILDPFCGSATTGVAAIQHGRNFVGIDSERSYLKIHAKPRLQDALQKNHLSLFETDTQHKQYG